jgi:quinoprotein glucose dehydrogenase
MLSLNRRHFEARLSLPGVTGNSDPLSDRTGNSIALSRVTGNSALRSCLLAAAVSLLAPAIGVGQQQTASWPVTEGMPGGGRYSPLADIHTGNVDRLEQAWVYRYGDGDYFDGSFPVYRGTSSETTPIVVDSRLILTTPTNRVIALDPESGEELWTFDPGLARNVWYANMWTNRGVTAWQGRPDDACAPRVFLTTLDARLIALDAHTGERCPGFADVRLHEGVRFLVDRREFSLTSPGTVVGDVIIVGSSVADWIRADSPHGIVRAFDARSGELRWTFQTIPAEGEPGSGTWETGTAQAGAANVWSTITADLERGLVFLPVSSASPDHYGGTRPGANLYSDSVVALDAKTGKLEWHFQTVHHDLWDYDLAAPPILVDIRRDERVVPAVVVVTKSSLVFVLQRETGEPIYPIEERAVPASDVPGERSSPTQPFPVKPPPLSSHKISDADLFDVTPEHRDACGERLAKLRNDGIYTPPSLQGTLVHPATGGGANWSGGAFDPERRLLFVPVNNLAIEIRLAPTGWIRRLFSSTPGERYRLVGGHVLFAHDGLPCNRPPWGRLVAVDLDKGEIAWSASTSTGPGDFGNSSYQPPLSTAGGLVFHGGTAWPVLRIHDAMTGEQIGRLELPAGVHGGAISYKLRPDSRQYVVVAAGGHDGLGSPKGDYVIAWALPQRGEAR